jgi:small subunit ribosomal protein S20
MKQAAEERDRNRAFRSRMRAAIKAVRTETTKANAFKKLVSATTIIDRAASDKLIHKRHAARQKSRLAQYVNSLG